MGTGVIEGERPWAAHDGPFDGQHLIRAQTQALLGRGEHPSLRPRQVAALGA